MLYLDVKILRNIATSSAQKADVILLVVDATQRFTDSYQRIFADLVKVALENCKIEMILVSIVANTVFFTSINSINYVF
jgi:GTPase Era involved in 16S rRNA processing